MDQPNIIIVDDTDEIRSSLKRELKDEPYNVFFAGSGKEALKMISDIPFKLIISDVKMPEMDGFELLEKVSERHPDMVTVILSGHSDVNLILSIVNERGINRYLTKPWHIDDVKLTIKQCIELYDLRKEVSELRREIESMRLK